MTSPERDERKAFEDAMRAVGAKDECFRRNALGEYVYYKDTGVAWFAWQARAALLAPQGGGLAVNVKALENYPAPWCVKQAPRGGNHYIYDARGERVPSAGTILVLQAIADCVNAALVAPPAPGTGLSEEDARHELLSRRVGEPVVAPPPAEVWAIYDEGREETLPRRYATRREADEACESASRTRSCLNDAGWHQLRVIEVAPRLALAEPPGEAKGGGEIVEAALRALCDAIDADHQPRSKDDLTYIRPGWIERVRYAAVQARGLIPFAQDHARILAAARAVYLDASLWAEKVGRLPKTDVSVKALDGALRQRDDAYEAVERAHLRTLADGGGAGA